MPEDRWLDDLHSELNNDLNRDLDAVLDIEAGLRDATLRGPIDQALDEAVDIESGLRAIVPETSEDTGLQLTGFAVTLTRLPPARRLAARAFLLPGTREAAWAAADLVTGTLDLYELRSRRSYPATTHVNRLEVTVPRLRRYVPGLQQTIRTLREELTEARARPDRLRAAAERVVPFFVDIFCATFATEIRRALASGIGHDYREALFLDLDRVRDTKYDGAHANLRYLVETIATARHHLQASVTDFAGADLADADLAGLDLEGTRWSSTTRWPRGWAARIERASIRIAPDLFEVRSDPRLDERVGHVP